MKKLFPSLALIGIVCTAVAFTVRRQFYVQATPERQSHFFRIFDLGAHMQTYVRQRVP